MSASGRNRVTKWLLIAAGSASLALGITGVFVPVLPTTPFLLLAALCYARSSARLYDKLMTSRHLGPYIKNYMENKAIEKKIKVRALAFLWIALLISFILVDNTYIRIFLPVIGSLVTLHILNLKSV